MSTNYTFKTKDYTEARDMIFAGVYKSILFEICFNMRKSVENKEPKDVNEAMDFVYEEINSYLDEFSVTSEIFS